MCDCATEEPQGHFGWKVLKACRFENDRAALAPQTGRQRRAPRLPQIPPSLRHAAYAPPSVPDPCIEPLAREMRHQCAQPRASEARIAVGRIFAVARRRLFSTSQRAAPWIPTAADGAGKSSPPRRRKGHGVGHAREPGQPAAASEPEQHGLGLIVQRVGRQDMFVAGAHRGLCQQPVACETRGFLQPRLGLLAVPLQRAMRDPEPPRQAIALARLRVSIPAAIRDRR